VQLFFTGRILGLLGVGLTLAVLPALTLFGFGTLALMPAISTLVVFQVLRRSCDYAVARPTREVLYTVLPREDRYKAKNFIDTVVYRAGDQVGAWSYALVAFLGFGPPVISAIAIVLALLWLINAWWLGRRQEVLAAGAA
jgi:AAA family ATP:ADP antiporter